MKKYKGKLPLKLKTSRLVVAVPELKDAPLLLDYAERNAKHFAPYTPAYPRGYFTLPYWKEKTKSWRKDFVEGRMLRVVLFPREEHKVIGEIGFNSIVRGYFQACYLGFGIDEEYMGKGLMFEAVQRSIRFAFDDMKLHRIMANHLPENRRSASLLERLGFTREGIAEDYLAIAGNWRTHALTSLTNKKLKSPIYS